MRRPVEIYMAERMAMSEAREDQGQNWIAGHMDTFAWRQVRPFYLSLRALIGVSMAAVGGQFRCNACDVMSPDGAMHGTECPVEAAQLLAGDWDIAFATAQCGTCLEWRDDTRAVVAGEPWRGQNVCRRCEDVSGGSPA